MVVRSHVLDLLGFGERGAADVTGPTIDTQRISGPLLVISRISSMSGAGASAVVRIEDSADGLAWATAGSAFPSRSGATVPPDVLAFDRVGRYVRAILDLSGTDPKVRGEVVGIL